MGYNTNVGDFMLTIIKTCHECPSSLEPDAQAKGSRDTAVYFIGREYKPLDDYNDIIYLRLTGQVTIR